MSFSPVLSSKKFLFVLVSVFLCTLFFFFIARSSIASYIWMEYQWGEVALALGVDDPDVLANIGSYHFNALQESATYNPGLALEAYKKVVAIDPDYPGAFHQIGRIHFAQGRLDEALAALEEGIERTEEEELKTSARYMRGLIYGFRNQPGDLEKAEADFRAYVEHHPSVWGGANDLAWILLKQRKNEEAIAVLEEFLVRNADLPDNPWVLNSLGVALMNENRFVEAVSMLERAVRASELITEEEWRAAYSGNSPIGVDMRIDSFKKGIQDNLSRAQEGGETE